VFSTRKLSQVNTELPKNNIAALLPIKKAELFLSTSNNKNINSEINKRTRQNESAIIEVTILTVHYW